MIEEIGPYIGYHPNGSKSTLVVKKQYLEQATMIYANTGITITCDRTKHLGACIGEENFKRLCETQSWRLDWRNQRIGADSTYSPTCSLRRLYSRSTAQIYLHYENYKQHWNSHDSLKNTIRSILLPVLLNGYSRSDMERNLFSLPAKFVAVWTYSNLKKDARLSMPVDDFGDLAVIMDFVPKWGRFHWMRIFCKHSCWRKLDIKYTF